MPLASPFSFPFGSPTVGFGPEEKKERDVFGVDIFFDGNTSVQPNGDYLEITGFENLRRSILRRLATSPGEYKVNPSYGVGIQKFVKKRITQSTIDQLKHRIRDNLARERRIDKIVSIEVVSKFFGNDTGIVVTLVIQTKGRQVRFEPFNFTQAA